MRLVIRHRGLFRAAAALLLVSFVQGCTHWQSVGVRQPHLRSGGETVRVHLDTGHLLTVHNAFVMRDSLFFSVADGLPADLSGARAIPLTRIQRIDARRVEPGSTTLVIACVALVVLVVWVISELDFSGIGSPVGQTARP